MPACIAFQVRAHNAKLHQSGYTQSGPVLTKLTHFSPIAILFDQLEPKKRFITIATQNEQQVMAYTDTTNKCNISSP